MSLFDLVAFLREVYNFYTFEIENKGLQLKLQFHDIAYQMIKSDQTLLKEIVQILIANAIKFTIRGSICIKLKKHREDIEIKIKDTGCGIESSKQGRMFQIFGNMKFKK